CSSSISATRLRISSSASSRISSARIGMRLLTNHELRFHTELGRRERHCLLARFAVDAFELEHHPARLDHGHPSFGRTLAFAHAGFGRLLRDRLVGENTDPDFAAALDVPRE